MDDIALLRERLDAIDTGLHDLLMERAALVARLAAHKRREGLAQFKPGREAQILRRLLARHAGPLDKLAVVRVWRAVLAGSVALQGRFVVAAAPEAAGLARAHFGAGVALLEQTAAEVLAALAAGAASVGVLPACGAWLPDLFDSRLWVVGRLPFFGPAAAEGGAWMVAAFPPDPSGEDASLLLCRGAAPVGRVLARGEGWSLAELPGFGAAAEAALCGFAVPARAIGAYALPAG